MKKTNIKHFIIVFTVLLAVIAVLDINFVFAQNVSPNKTNAFCVKIGDFVQKITSRLVDQQKKVEIIRGERENDISKKSDAVAQNLEEIRAKWDTNRAENFVKLEEKATTDNQKQAVSKFKSDTESAVALRKTAVDKALLDFKNGISSILESKKTGDDLAIKAFTDSVNAAIAKVEADCNARVDGKTARTTLASSLKLAKTKLQADIKGSGKSGEKVKALVEIRKTAVEKAKEDFKNSLEKAKTEIKAAFAAAQ